MADRGNRETAIENRDLKMRNRSGIGISHLALTLWLTIGAIAVPAAEAGVPLDSYLEGAAPPSGMVSGFTLAFEGDLDHAVQFQLGPSPALLVRADLTFPNGGSTRRERYVEASDGPRRVSFGLGPLLGHGPWMHRPKQFYPGEYTLRVSGRDPVTEKTLFQTLFRLPPQEWIWADLDRARDPANLTTLCGDCHRSIAGRELDFVERLGGPPVRAEWVPRPRIPWNRLDNTKLVRIARFEYVGERETYDLEVEGPHHNFVANGIITHNSVNEYSGRYSLMPLLFYSPEQDQFSLQSAVSNQGRAPGSVSPDFYREAMRRWDEVRARAAGDYGWLVGENVARELARIDLPLSTYTQWYWKIDLHNLLHFLTLRVDDHAQWEIREYGRVIAGMVKRVAPLSYEAWVDYQVMGDKLSHGDVRALARLVAVDGDGLAARDGSSLSNADLAGLGLSGREIRELKAKLEPREVPDYDLDLATMRDPEDVAAEMLAAVPEVDR